MVYEITYSFSACFSDLTTFSHFSLFLDFPSSHWSVMNSYSSIKTQVNHILSEGSFGPRESSAPPSYESSLNLVHISKK